MAIADVADYAHLSAVDIEALAQELEIIRRDVQDSRVEPVRVSIQRTIASCAASTSPPG